MNSTAKVTLDAVLLEVIRNRITAIANEMSVALQRSAYSTNIKTRRDFSCAIFDGDARAIAHSFSQPVHLGSLTHFVPCILAELEPTTFQPGDAILCNDAYRGGVHLNDVCLLAPVFEGGIVAAYVATIAHHLDIGGSTPGSMVGLSTEVLQEGIRIPPIRLLRSGEIESDLFNLLTNNVRSIRDTKGDLRAQIAGVTIGISRMHELYDRYGVSIISSALEDLITYTERRVRTEIGRIPNGSFHAVDYMDDDGNNDEPVKISVRVEVRDESIVFDLSGSAPQRNGPINCTYAMTLSCCAYALRSLLAQDISSNDGFYRLVELVAPKGTVVNPEFPAPVGGGWETGNRVTETALLALSQAIPERLAAASKGCFSNVAFGAYSPHTSSYVMCYETVCGGYGARASKDGIDAIQAHGQNTENGPAEETEAAFPVYIQRHALISDSEGPGKYRGGLGVRRDYQFTEDVTLSVLADRAKYRPWGLAGGMSARGTKVILDPDGERNELATKTSLKLCAGQTISIQMGGGGGYGPPTERDPAKVLFDIRAEKVSTRRAFEIYGVVVSEDLSAVDANATKLRRQSLRNQSAASAT